jgi:hypothetical protein
MTTSKVTERPGAGSEVLILGRRARNGHRALEAATWKRSGFSRDLAYEKRLYSRVREATLLPNPTWDESRFLRDHSVSAFVPTRLAHSRPLRGPVLPGN